MKISKGLKRENYINKTFVCYLSMLVCYFFTKTFSFLKYLLILKSTVTEREGETDIFHPGVHSPCDHNNQGWSRLKPRATSRSPARVQGFKQLGHPPCFTQAICRELDCRWNSQDRMVLLQMVVLLLCHKTAALIKCLQTLFYHNT